MASVVGDGKVKLDNGQVVTAANGGWYDGQHYMNGAIKAERGVHWETGKVSNEVIAQTNPNNVAYVNGPTSKDQVTPFLSQFQNGMLASGAPQTRVQSPEEIKAQLKPNTELPELLNRSKRFDELRTSYGVAALEENMTLLKSEQDELYAQNRIQTNAQRGSGVASNVVEGRIGEIERQNLERGDYLGRQVARITDELNTKYNVINLYMNFESLDYNDAVARYEDEYTKNLQVYEIIEGQKKQARSEWEYDQQAARANLQMYANAITSGNLDAGSMSADQRLMLNKLEVQSGLPMGFVSSLQMSTKDRLININEKTGEALMVGEGGGFKVVQTGFRTATGGSGGSGSTKNDTKNQYSTWAAQDAAKGSTLEQLVNHYGVAGGLSIDDIYRTYNQNTTRGTAKESLAQVKQGIYANKAGFK